MVCNRSCMMFLPNPKGTIRRDNDRRQKAHRTALQSIRGDVDSSQPKSARFSRVVDLKKARQEDDRIDHVEKCNRKLVTRMMLIMQGFGGTVATEQKIQEFNPGTLNRSLRRREIIRINRDNLALMHRIEKASSDYRPKLLEPKHFQMPHMGLFPRVSDSVKFVGKRSKGRGEKASQRKRKRAHSSPGYSVLGMEESATSALMEPSSIHQLRSAVVGRPGRPISGGKDAEEAKESDVPESEDEGVGLVTRTTEWMPQPPCASTSYGTTRSKQRPNKLLTKSSKVRPGPVVYHGGVKVGDDYMVLSVTRHGGKNANELDGDGRIMFRLQVYSPTLLTIYSLEISAKRLPAFTLGNRTAAREMFQPGQRSKRLWENVAACLELKTPTLPAPTGTDTERDEQRGEVDSNSGMDDPTTEMTSKPMFRKSTVDSVVLANATGNATSKLVLVPPSEASIVAIQRIFRGLQTRRKYDVLKGATIFIQVTTRLWRERARRRKHAAASKISSLVRRRQERIREQRRIAAAKIQKHSRAWVIRHRCAKSEAAKKIQSMFRERYLPSRQTPDRALCEGMADQKLRKASPVRSRNSPRGRSSVTPRGNGYVCSRGVALGEVEKACHEAQCAKLAGRGANISPEKPLIFSPLHGGLPDKSETSSDIKNAADVGLLCEKALTGSPLARNSMRPRPPDTKNLTRSSFYSSGRGRTARRTGGSIIAHPHLVLVTPVALAGSSHPNRNIKKEQKGHPRSFPRTPGKSSNSPPSSSVHAAHNRAGMSNRARQLKEMERSRNALHRISLAARSPAPRAGRIVRVMPVATSNKTGQGKESHADGGRDSSAQNSDTSKPSSRERREEPKAPPSSDQSDSGGQRCKSREGNSQPDAEAVEQQNPERGDKTPSSSTSCARALPMKPEARIQEREVVVEPDIAVEQGGPEEGAKANESVEPPTKTIPSGVKLRRSVSWAGDTLTSELSRAYDATLLQGAKANESVESPTKTIPSGVKLRRSVSWAGDTLTSEMPRAYDAPPPQGGPEEGANSSKDIEKTTKTIPSGGKLRRSVSWAEDILLANETSSPSEATFHHDSPEEGAKASESAEQTTKTIPSSGKLRSSVSWAEGILANETSPHCEATFLHEGPEEGTKACEGVEHTTQIIPSGGILRSSVSCAEDVLANETSSPSEATLPQGGYEQGAKANESVEQTTKIIPSAVKLRSSVSCAEGIFANETSSPSEATLPQGGSEQGVKANESVEQTTQIIPSDSKLRSSVSWGEQVLANETSPPSEATLPQGGPKDGAKASERVEQTTETKPSGRKLRSSVSRAEDILANETSPP